MSCVTDRINEITQPKGGFLSVKNFDKIKLDDIKELNNLENVHGSLIGMAVDYLTRFIMTKDAINSFRISIMGGFLSEKMKIIKNGERISKKLLNNIKGLDDESIICACKLVSFDVFRRNPSVALAGCKTYEDINPDNDTIDNVRTLVNRSLNFFEKYGPIKVDGFTFEKEGYTKTVDSGDGDFLTKDTLWDFKVSKSAPTSKHTLQLLMYYIMGKHSKQEIYKNITKIGIYNPRLNIVYIYDMNNYPKELIEKIEDEVICY